MRTLAPALALALIPCLAQAKGFNDSRKTVPAEPGELRRSLSPAEPVSIPTVPGDEIFGFTSPTDVGNPGDVTLAIENNGRYGKAAGSFTSVTTKYELGRTLTDRFWAGVSLFSTGTRLRGIPEIGPDNDRFAYDGASFELQYVVLQRTASNPLAIAINVEPGYARLDAFTARNRSSFVVTPKLFADLVVVPDTLYAAVNLSYAPQYEHGVPSSQLAISGALTYQATHQFFVGMEARYLDAFNRANLSRFAGDAVFVGPTFLYELTDTAALNLTWQPQVSGKQKGVQGRFDTADFERQTFRLKLTVGF